MTEKGAVGTVIGTKKRSAKKPAEPSIPGLWLRDKIFWYRPKMVAGVRAKPFSLDTTDRGQAILKILEYQKRPELIDAGQWEVLVNKYIAQAVADKQLSRLYAPTRQYVLLDFGRTYEITTPRQVSEAICQKYYNDLKQGSLNTAKHYLVHLRVFLDWCVAERRIPENHARKIKVIKVRTTVKADFVEKKEVRRQLAFARMEVRRLRLETAKKKRLPQDIEAIDRAVMIEFMLYMGYDAGFRKNEMIEARTLWFSRDRHTVHIAHTATYSPKDHEARHIPLSSRFRRFLKREYPDRLPGPWVLQPEKVRGKQAYRFEPKKAFASFMNRCDAISVNGRRPNLHMLRHSFISNRLLDGVSIYRVSKWSGDEIETMMLHYGHLLAKDDEINKGV